MKKYIKAAACLLTAGILTANAQQTYSGYFLDDYTYGFQMNPAFGNSDNFVSMPVLGNLNIAMRGNLHLNSIFYNYNNETVLFTNPGISEKEAMKKFHDKNRLETGVNLNIMSAGFKQWGGYNTISLGVKANANVSAPKAFFQLAKEGIENKTYDIKNLRANANAYAQIALNHSRDIKEVPGLRVGAALKFYIGAGNLDAYFNRAELELGENSWNALTNADIYASASGLKYKAKYNDRTDREYVDGVDYSFEGLNGFGMGFDLGAQYKWNDFNFSLAILDLGFMSWGKTQWASTNGDREVRTDAYIFSANGEADNSFENEWDNFKDGLSSLYELTDNGELSSRTRAMAATLNWGVEYELPYYRPLHFGLLNSTVINGAYTWTQFRISANVKPIKWFSASANLELGTFGPGFGWLANFYTKGINFFVGMDHTMSKLAKQGVPLNSNASVNFGLNFPF